MMLYPSVNELVKSTGNRYSLVIATAKRARQVADEAESEGRILDDKPVKIAINEIYEGKVICKTVPQKAKTAGEETQPPQEAPAQEG